MLTAFVTATVFATAIASIGCSPAPPPNMPPDPGDPLAGAEEPLVVQTLPGAAPLEWPLPVAYSAGRYLLPYRDGSTLHALIVSSGGATADFALGDEKLLDVAPWRAGFAVATFLDRVTIHFLDGESVTAVQLDAAGTLVPAIASDGERVMVAATVPNPTPPPPTGFIPPALDAHAFLVDLDGPIGREVGLVDAMPSLYGDRAGFIVGGRWRLAAIGAVDNTPAAQLPGARLYRAAAPLSDSVTTDGAGWLDVGGVVAWAYTDDAGAAIGVMHDGAPDDVLLASPALAPLGRVALPSTTRALQPGWMRGFRGGRALWEAPIAGQDGRVDHAFAVVDRATLAPRGTFTRAVAPTSRTVVALLGDTDILFAWMQSNGDPHHPICRFALYPR